MLNKPSIVEHNKYRFMIFSAPDNNTLDYWIEVCNFTILRVKFFVKTNKFFRYLLNIFLTLAI